MNALRILVLTIVLVLCLHAGQAQNGHANMDENMPRALEFGLWHFNALDDRRIDRFVSGGCLLHDARAGDRDTMTGFRDLEQLFSVLISTLSSTRVSPAPVVVKSHITIP